MELKNSLYEVFRTSATAYADKPFLAVPRRHTQVWEVPNETSYAQALARIDSLRAAYAQHGLQVGDRVALAFESRPEYIFHYLALNALGACAVPLNTDLTVSELSYQIGHAKCGAVLGLPSLHNLLARSIDATGLPITLSTTGPQGLGVVWRPHGEAIASAASAQGPAAILYTSGTTGKPKGCVLTNVYLQEAAAYNASLSGDIEVAEGAERIMNPLPLYHMNSMVSTLGSVILRGACFVLPGRFSATHWWTDIADTRATRFNYLGIMIPALMGQPEAPQDRNHGVKYAFGAGVEPALHERFEKRFGISLMEVWGMTETGRFLIVDREPRYIETRACGRPLPGLEARIVDDGGAPVPDGVVGELVVRHSADNPRHGFFSGYLDDPSATEAAWTSGWFHSGDLCSRSADGMFTFVDRKKNIVRRSGENISSAEVEAALAASPQVGQVTVLAVPDALRDEEVLACVVPAVGVTADRALAQSLHEHVGERLAYFKTPGWIYFVDALPVTGTQKVQKHRIFPHGFSPDTPGLHDLRDLKRWKK